MGLIQSFFSARNRAQSSGLSPSQTDDTGQKILAPVTEGTESDAKLTPVVSDDKAPEQPESNDTSYGVEATAVRTLAASTGTVAILGTTAKVKEVNDVIDESFEPIKDEPQCPSISVTEPEPDIPETVETTEIEQVGLEEKANQPKTDEPKKPESPEISAMSNEKHITDATQAKKSEEINNESTKADLESTQPPTETATLGKQEDVKPNQVKEKYSSEEQIPLKQPEQTQDEIKETKILSQDSVESTKMESKAHVEERFQSIQKEQPRLPPKEPVRIVDYQEKKDISLPKKPEEKLPYDFRILEQISTKSEIPQKVEEFGLQDKPETISEKKEVDSEDEGKIPNDSDGAPDESEGHDDSKTEEDNEISSEQLKTNSLSDMSLSDVMNSEGEEAAREAAKAQELREMVASLSATAEKRDLDYEFQSAGNSRDNFQGYVGTSSYYSEGIEPILESPLQHESEELKFAEKEIQGEQSGSKEQPQLPKRSEIEQASSTKLEHQSQSKDILEREKDSQKESRDMKGAVKEPEIKQEKAKESEKAIESVNESEGMPEELNILEDEEEQIREPERKLEFLKDVDEEREPKPKHEQDTANKLDDKETSKEFKEIKDPGKKEEVNETKDEHEKSSKIEGENEKLKELEKVKDLDQKKEGKQDLKEQEEFNKSIEQVKLIEPEQKLEEVKPQQKVDDHKGKEETIIKLEEIKDKIEEPEQKLQSVNIPEEVQEKIKELAAKEDIKTDIAETDQTSKTENEKELKSFQESKTESAVLEEPTSISPIKTFAEIPEVDPLKQKEPSIVHKEIASEDITSLEQSEITETMQVHAPESPSDASEPGSNGSNDESKLTEESRLSDKEEITEIDILPERFRKERDVEQVLSEEKDSESVKDDSPSINQIEPEMTHPYDIIDNNLNAAATTIQSSFRGFKTRKQMKECEKPDEEEVKSLGKDNNEKTKNMTDVNEKDKIQESMKEKALMGQEVSVELKEEKPAEKEDPIVSEHKTQSNESKSVPEPLMKIAQAEVDRICQEAEKATESLMTPPPMMEDSDVRETDQEDSEDFPAPPDDLMDPTDRTDDIKDQDSSGTQSTEPTVPLGSNTDGDSSKTEDTTAPSLAESEIKSNEPTASQQHDDYKLESSFTENINTEVAVNRDSTEGELTMEEDSKEEELGSVLQSSKEQDLESNDKEEEREGAVDEENKDKAAAIIQARYRGFKTRKDLKKATGSGGTSVEEEKKEDITTLEEPPLEKHNIISSSNENSESEPKEDSSSTSKSEEELNESAKKIQAGIRGYLVRKDQKVKRDAAVKIQSHFRGFKTRQRLKQESP